VGTVVGVVGGVVGVWVVVVVVGGVVGVWVGGGGWAMVRVMVEPSWTFVLALMLCLSTLFSVSLLST
jgi:hypothetical protein